MRRYQVDIVLTGDSSTSSKNLAEELERFVVELDGYELVAVRAESHEVERPELKEVGGDGQS